MDQFARRGPDGGASPGDNDIQYRLIFETVFDGLEVIDAETGRIVLANQAAATMFGFGSPEEMVGLDPLDYIPREDRQLVARMIAEHLFEKNVHEVIELRCVTKDGRLVWLSAIGVRTEYQGKPAGLVSMRDITRQKLAEEQLRRSEAENRLLIENANEGIVVVQDGVMRFVNPYVTVVSGYSREELISKPFIEFIHSDDREMVVGQYLRRVEGKETLSAYQFRFVTKDGNTRWGETNVVHYTWDGRPAVLAFLSDITERKQTEKREYKTIISSAMDSFCVADAQGRLLDVNDACCSLLGYSREELMNMHIGDIEAIETAEQPGQRIRKIMQVGKDRFETRLRRQDTKIIDVEASVNCMDSEGGRVFIFLRDITERKKAEEAIGESELRYRLLAENLSDVIWTMDTNLRYTYLSPSVTSLRGYSAEEAMALSMEETMTPASLQTALRVMAEAEAKEGIGSKSQPSSVTLDLELNCKDGSTVWVENRVTYLRDAEGRLTGYQGVSLDITERKKAEEALQASEQRYRLLAENLSDIIWTMGTDLKYTYISPSVTLLRGYTVEEAMAQPLAENLTPASLETAMKLMVEEEAKERTGQYDPNRSISMEVELSCKNGSNMWAENRVTYLRDSNGQITAYLGVTRDITGRKQAEARQQQVQAQLALSSRLASIGQLASGVAHEINNPLSVVIGCSQMLMEKDVPKDIKEDVDMVHDSAQRVAEIVKGLLVFARQSRPGKSYVDINAVVSRVVGLRAPEMRINDIMVSARLDPDLPRTMVDEGQIQQVFLNIVVNAEQAITEAHGDGHLRIKTERIGDIIRISFKDDGIGISEEHLTKLFDPFFTTKQVGEGTGLGLSISYGIIREHKGNIYAKGKPGKGATFVVELPIVAKPDDLESLEEGPAKDLKRKATGRILVVDDEPAVCRILARLLTQDGHKVETAGDANAALKKMKGKRFSLVLADVKMKGMSGIELYEHLGKTDQSMQRRVVFITGDTLARDTRDFLEKTKAPCISKPFDVEHIKERVNLMLAKM